MIYHIYHISRSTWKVEGNQHVSLARRGITAKLSKCTYQITCFWCSLVICKWHFPVANRILILFRNVSIFDTFLTLIFHKFSLKCGILVSILHHHISLFSSGAHEDVWPYFETNHYSIQDRTLDKALSSNKCHWYQHLTSFTVIT